MSYKYPITNWHSKSLHKFVNCNPQTVKAVADYKETIAAGSIEVYGALVCVPQTLKEVAAEVLRCQLEVLL